MKVKHQTIPTHDPNPVADQATLEALAARALAGENVTTQSIPEYCALLQLLKARGYETKLVEDNRSMNRPPYINAPFVFQIRLIETGASVSAETRMNKA